MPAASCPNVGREWGAKHSTLLNVLCDLSFFRFLSNAFFDLSKTLHIQVIIRNLKLLLFAKKKVRFNISNDFENFRILTKFHKQLSEQNYFRKSMESKYFLNGD